MESTNPTVRQLVLRMALKSYREHAGVTRAEAAEAIGVSVSMVSRMETGERGISPEQAETLLRRYGVDEAQIHTYVEVAEAAKERGWYSRLLRGSKVVAGYPFYIAVEADAKSIREYSLGALPGLCQTRAYARAAISGGPVALDPHEIDRLVELRVNRQKERAKHDPELHFVIGEGAIRAVVGDREIMREQLHRLLETADEPKVTLQVVPFSRGLVTISEGVTIFQLPGFGLLGDDLTVVCQELTAGLVFPEGPEAEFVIKTWEHAQASALTPDDSRRLIADVASTL